MDEAKSKYIVASEVYAAIDSGNTPLGVDTRRAGFRCRCPAHHITAWRPASRSCIALRRPLVASVFRAVRDCPFAGVLDGPARWLSGAKALDGRQRLHLLPPFPDRREVRVHRLRFRSEAKGVSAGQQVIIRETHLPAQQEALAMRQLAFHHFQRDLDLRQRVRDDLLVGRDAKLREDVTLVRDVVAHVRVLVGIDCTDPLVHSRAALGGLWSQRRRRKHLFQIADDRACLVEREVAVLQDRHPVERVQHEMYRRTHVGFEVAECVRQVFVRQDQTRDLDESAAGKPSKVKSDMVFSPIVYVPNPLQKPVRDVRTRTRPRSWGAC
jgi:hypothetical protein